MLPSRKPVSRGPMPRPNSEAGTLQECAASRWPNSWTIIASAANPITEISIDIRLQPSRGGRVSRPMPSDFPKVFEESQREVTKIVTRKQTKIVRAADKCGYENGI